MPRYRLTLVDDRTGRPVDTRICNRNTPQDIEDWCSFIIPRVAHMKGIDIVYLRGVITELVPAVGADPAMAAALTAAG